MNSPDVTVLIPTYARVRALEAAVWSALVQDYPGEVRVLILNDCDDQRLSCDHPRVNVINDASYPSLGEKRNALLACSGTEWITFLDDDDFLLPWHCRRLDGGESALALFSDRHVFAHGDALTLKNGPVPIDMLMRTKGVAFDALDAGEDQLFRGRVAAYGAMNGSRPSYVYCWGNGVFHISGDGTAEARTRFRTNAAERIARGDEPHGYITLNPHKPILYDAAVALTKPHSRTAP